MARDYAGRLICQVCLKNPIYMGLKVYGPGPAISLLKGMNVSDFEYSLLYCGGCEEEVNLCICPREGVVAELAGRVVSQQ